MEKAFVSLQGTFNWLVPSLVAVALPWASYGGVRTVSAAIDNQTDGFTITLGEASGTANTVFAAYGATDAGTTPSAWEHVARVGVVAAEDSTISFAAPKEWESSAHAIRFFAVDGDLSGDIPVQYVSGEDANVSFPLNYVPKADTRTQIKFMYTHHNGSTFFGTPYATDENADYRFFQGNDNSTAYLDMGLAGQRVSQANVLADPAAIRHFEIGNQYITDLDTDADIVRAESAVDLTGYTSALQLFAGGDYGRIYSLKIYEGETLKLNLEPYLKADGTPAFRDSLTGNFYEAAGTGVVGSGVPVALINGTLQCSTAIEDPVSAAPAYTDFAKKLRVTPTGSAVVAVGVEYADVPVLLRLSESISGFSYADFTRGGKDMLILDEESNALPYEIEVWNPSGESLVWVKVPTYSGRTRITVYYGDSQGRRNGANDPKQVWSAYAGVWHLDELGTEIVLADSSPNGYDGKTYLVSEGLSGGVLGNYTRNIDKRSQSGQCGLYFEGTKNIMHGGKLTLSAYVKRYQLNYCWDHLFYSKNGSSEGSGFASEFYAQDKAWGDINMIGAGSNTSGVHSKHGFEDADTWYHVAMTFDGQTAYYYLNGVRKGGGTMTAAANRSGKRFALGNDSDLNGTPWDGAFDEFRVSVGAMSQERIALEYALMQSGAMTITAGDNTGVRLQFGDLSVMSNGDGTFAASAAIVAGTAVSVKVVLSEGTEGALADGGESAPWIAQSISGIAVDTSFTARFCATDASGDTEWILFDDTFYSGTISVAATADAFEEDLSAGEFVFSRTEGDAATAYPLVVNYSVAGSANPGTDYTALSGTVTIPAGESSASVSVSPLKNAETDDNVSVAVSLAAGNYVSSDSTAQVEIVNARSPAAVGYSKRMPICVAQGKYSGAALTDFPVLVRLTPSAGGFSYDDFVREDYTDLAFIDEGMNVIPYEVQKWDTNGTSLVWVKVPSFSATTTIYALYGAEASGRTATSAVWSGYTGVWHMDESASGGVTMADATANALDGTYGGQSYSTNGVFGSARRMCTAAGKPDDRGRALVSVKDAMNVDEKYLHASMWVCLRGDTSWAYLITRKDADDTKIWGFQFDDTNQKLRFWGDGGTSTGMSWGSFSDVAEYSNNFPKNTWLKLDMTYSEGTYYLYVNGKRTATATNMNWCNGGKRYTQKLAIGGPCGGGTWGTFNGDMDEVRITSAFTPSADWVAASYANEADEAFLTLGTPMDVSSTAPSVGSASLATVDGKSMIAVPLNGGEGRVYVILRDSLGNVTTNAVTDGIVSAGTYYYPVSSLPVNLNYDVGTYAEGENGKTDMRKYSVQARNGKVEEIVLRVAGYTGVSAVENFPALVRLSEGLAGFSYLKLTDEGETSGDIHFQDADGNELPFEVDTWNPKGESLFWVKMPLLRRGAKIVLVYGAEYTPETSADANRAAVWSGQTGVWHLEQGADGYFGNSANADTAILRGYHPQSATSAASSQDRLIGAGRLISDAEKGVGDKKYIQIGKNSLLSLGNNFTVSLWMRYKKGQHPGNDRIISKKTSYDKTNGWELFFIQNETTSIGVRGSDKNRIGAETFTAESNPFVDGEWRLVSLVYNGTSLVGYINGEEKINGTIAAVLDDANVPLAFGASPDSNDASFHTFKGWLDEIRLGAGSLSADRIKADYETVANPDFFSASEVVTGFIVIIK